MVITHIITIRSKVYKEQAGAARGHSDMVRTLVVSSSVYREKHGSLLSVISILVAAHKQGHAQLQHQNT